MSGIRGKDTKPEISVRKMLHQAGFRFRLHDRQLPGKPDVVLAKYRTAIFVHGCFWHGHKDCALFRLPGTRPEFWSEKIGGNVKRDESNIVLLMRAGWKVAIVWECTLKGRARQDSAVFIDQIANFIRYSEEQFMEFRGVTNTL